MRMCSQSCAWGSATCLTAVSSDWGDAESWVSSDRKGATTQCSPNRDTVFVIDGAHRSHKRVFCWQCRLTSRHPSSNTHLLRVPHPGRGVANAAVVKLKASTYLFWKQSKRCGTKKPKWPIGVFCPAPVTAAFSLQKQPLRWLLVTCRNCFMRGYPPSRALGLLSEIVHVK